jgi:hypothetical protein
MRPFITVGDGIVFKSDIAALPAPAKQPFQVLPYEVPARLKIV